MTKINKIRKVADKDDLNLAVEDLEEDFDPEKYEKKMQVSNLSSLFKYNFIKKN